MEKFINNSRRKEIRILYLGVVLWDVGNNQGLRFYLQLCQSVIILYKSLQLATRAKLTEKKPLRQ